MNLQLHPSLCTVSILFIPCDLCVILCIRKRTTMKPYPAILMAFTHPKQQASILPRKVYIRPYSCQSSFIQRYTLPSEPTRRGNRLCRHNPLSTSYQVEMDLKRNSTSQHEPTTQKHQTKEFSNGGSIVVSLLLILSGATLGPFLDSYHSAFGVLQYHSPWSVQLWGGGDINQWVSSSSSSMIQSSSMIHIHPPALITTWWVPLLFGLAGFIIGWLYILLDASRISMSIHHHHTHTHPQLFHNHTFFFQPMNPQFHTQAPFILCGIACFTFQYWISGYLYANTDMHSSTLLLIMILNRV